MKNILSIISLNAYKIKKLPKDLTEKSAITQLDHFWFPLLQSLFGSVERFVYLISRSNSG